MLLLHIGNYEIYAETYTNGKITVEHKELPVKRNRNDVLFNHPYDMPAQVLTNILDNLYYQEKAFFKNKKPEKIFQDDEVKKLTPLLIQAFSVATPMQVISVVSYSDRFLLSDQQNYCILFIDDSYLNIAFSKIHKFQTYSDVVAEKKGLSAPKNPTTINKSRFWQVLPTAGQRLEPGHTNWLVIDLSNSIFQQPVSEKTEPDSRYARYTNPAQANRSEQYKRHDTRNTQPKNSHYYATQPQSVLSESQPEHRKSKIKNKLLILRELVFDGIITKEDYDSKKVKLLKEGLEHLDIVEQLREIKALRLEHLITEDDYENKKRELLDNF